MKKIIASALALAISLALAACGLSVNGGESGAAEQSGANAQSGEPAYNGTDVSYIEEEPETFEAGGATEFTFSDSGIEVKEGEYSGYKIEGTSLSIKESGVYVVSGSCENGAIVVKKNVKDVTLVLNGLKLSASATAAITCGKASEVKIFAAEGSVNDLADDEYNNDDVYTNSELYPKKNLTTVVQRAAAAFIFPLLLIHINTFNWLRLCADSGRFALCVILLIAEVLFFGTVIAHTAVSFSRALITLGVLSSPKALRITDRTAYISGAVLFAASSASVLYGQIKMFLL